MKALLSVGWVLVACVCTAMAMTEGELTAAIAAAESGGTVEVTGDVDLSASLTIDKQLTIRGVGEVRPVLRRTIGAWAGYGSPQCVRI